MSIPSFPTPRTGAASQTALQPSEPRTGLVESSCQKCSCINNSSDMSNSANANVKHGFNYIHGLPTPLEKSWKESWGCSPQETRDWGWTVFLFQNNNNKKFLEIVSWRPGWPWTCSIAKDHLKFLILSVPPKCRDRSRVLLHPVHAALREEQEAPYLHRPGKYPTRYRKATHPAPTRFLLFTQTGLKLEYK